MRCDTIKIRDGMNFNFYMGLPHMYSKHCVTLVTDSTSEFLLLHKQLPSMECMCGACVIRVCPACEEVVFCQSCAVNLTALVSYWIVA